MPNPRLCAICGFREASTRDHIPPRGVFPRPLPVRMITVPACRECNNGAADQDEAFRTYLAAATAHYHDRATQVWHEQAMRSLQKNQRLQREFIRNLPTGGAPITLPDGRTGIPLQWPVRVYSPVLERMARGLYFHHQARALGCAAACEVNMLAALPERFHEMTDPWPGGEVGDQVFTYRYAILDGLRSYWIFQFFRSHWGTVETFPKDEGPALAGAEE